MRYLILILGFFFSFHGFGQKTLVTDKIKMDGKKIERIVDDSTLTNVTDSDLATAKAIKDYVDNNSSGGGIGGGGSTVFFDIDTFGVRKLTIGNVVNYVNQITSEENTVDLCPEIGQSNAFGGNGTSLSNISSSYLSPNPNVKVRNKSTDAWENLHIGQNNFSAQNALPDRVNMDFAFYDAAQSVFEGDVYRLVYAEGGQKISRFRSGGIGRTTFYNDYFVSGINDLIGEGKKIKVWPLVLMQGEANAQSIADIRIYKAELKDFIQTYREAIHPELGFVLCEILSSAATYADSINQIFREVVQDYDNIYLLDNQGYVSTGDDVHLDESSQYLRAKRLFEVYLNNPNSAVYITDSLFKFSYAKEGLTYYNEFNELPDSVGTNYFEDINGKHAKVLNAGREVISWLGDINPTLHPFGSALMRLKDINISDCEVEFWVNAQNTGTTGGIILRASNGLLSPNGSIKGIDVNIQDNRLIVRQRSGAANFETFADESIPSIIGGAHIKISLKGQRLRIDLSYDNKVSYTNYIDGVMVNNGFLFESGEIWFRSGTSSSSSKMYIDDLFISY